MSGTNIPAARQQFTLRTANVHAFSRYPAHNTGAMRQWVSLHRLTSIRLGLCILGTYASLPVIGRGQLWLLRWQESERILEAHAFASDIRMGNERYASQNGVFLTDAMHLDWLACPAGGPPNWGLNFFEVSGMHGVKCPGGGEGYALELLRKADDLSARYGQYSVLYNHCTQGFSYPSCRNCDRDFTAERLAVARYWRDIRYQIRWRIQDM